MRTLFLRLICGFNAAAFCLTLSQGAMAAEVTLNLISAYPRNANLNKPMLGFVEEVNRRGKGVVRIRNVGGPEVTPVSEQLGSVQRGINHIYYGSTSGYLAQIDEARALNLSEFSAMELRQRGAFKILGRHFENKPKLHYLGYFGSGYTFYIYLNKEPKRTADGVDLSGFRIRGPSLYHSVIFNLKGTPVNVDVAEIYEALSRGTVDGIGWADMGLSEFSWQTQLKYRLLPSFWRGDLSMVVQLAAWNSLSREGKDLLTEMAAKYEKVAYDFLGGLIAEETGKLRAAGVKDIELKGAARAAHLRAANETLWKIVEDKSGKSVRDELEAAFTKQSK
jgi:TRAP-type C4-dicarboxylate transport system substrate-binding protein